MESRSDEPPIIPGFPEQAMENIRAAIANSLVPEDPGHAVNTLAWLDTMCPKAGPALRIAAYAHDVERGFVLLRVSKKQFPSYDQYKAAHAKNSARILKIILGNHRVAPALAATAASLVERHEFGGDPDSDLLKQADSLSFFDVNLPLFLKRHGWERALSRSAWGLKRLVPDQRSRALDLNRHRPLLYDLLQTAMAREDLVPGSS